MKAIRCFEYGPPDVLKLVEVETPVPGPREIQIRIHATTVSAEDPKLRAFHHPPLFRLPIALLFGYPRPRHGIWGMELAGEVTAVGTQTTRFTVGDRVFGYTGTGHGAYAEYRCLPETAVIAKIPPGVTYAEAAAIPNGALSALTYLRKWGKLQPGERVLVYGASGSVGTAAVQLAKAFGAHVTGVCSTRNVTLVESLGADHVIDYTRRGFRQLGTTYDLVFDTVGRTAWGDVEPCLTPRGRYLVTVFGFVDWLRILWTSLRGGQKMLGGASDFHWKPEDLELLGTLATTGRWKSVIDQTFPWHEAAGAHRYVEQGHKRGNVVLLVRPDGQTPEPA